MRSVAILSIVACSAVTATACSDAGAPSEEGTQTSELAAADSTVNELSALLADPKRIEKRAADCVAYITFSLNYEVCVYALRKEGGNPIDTVLETDTFLTWMPQAVFLIDTKLGTVAGATYEGIDSAARIRDQARRFVAMGLSDTASGAKVPATLEAVQNALAALGNTATPVERTGRAARAPTAPTALSSAVEQATYGDGNVKLIGLATRATAPTAKFGIEQKVLDRLARQTRESVLVGNQSLTALRKKSGTWRVWLMGAVDVGGRPEFSPYLEKLSAAQNVTLVSDSSTAGPPVDEQRLPKVHTLLASPAEDASHVNPNAVSDRALIAGRSSTDLRMNVLLPNVDEVMTRAWFVGPTAPQEHISWAVRAVEDFKVRLTILQAIPEAVKDRLEKAGLRSFDRVQVLDSRGEVSQDWKRLMGR